MGRKQKYTEEEKKERKRQYNKQYYQKHKDKMAEYNKQYHQKHKNEKSEYNKQYYQKNRDEMAEYNKRYYQERKDELVEYHKQYYKQYLNTPIGRAKNLLRNYNQNDNKKGRGDGNLTAEWIVKHIFSKSCVYCGESDWFKLGCDRKDNSRPHTKDNVVPCCGECNVKKGRMSYDEYMESIE